MVGNGTPWDFPGRERGDCSRITWTEFTWLPTKTDKGWRWLRTVRAVSTIEWVEDKGIFSAILTFFAGGGMHQEEIIRYEAL